MTQMNRITADKQEKLSLLGSLPEEIVKVFSIWSTNLGLYSVHIIKINRLRIFKYSFL